MEKQMYQGRLCEFDTTNQFQMQKRGGRGQKSLSVYIRETPDMMSTSEGGFYGKADVEREVA